MPGRFLKQLMPVVYVAFVAFYILIKKYEHPRTWSAALYGWGLSRFYCINCDCKLLKVMKPNAVVVSFLVSLFTGCLLEVNGKHGIRVWCCVMIQRDWNVLSVVEAAPTEAFGIYRETGDHVLWIQSANRLWQRSHCCRGGELWS